MVLNAQVCVLSFNPRVGPASAFYRISPWPLSVVHRRSATVMWVCGYRALGVPHGPVGEINKWTASAAICGLSHGVCEMVRRDYIPSMFFESPNPYTWQGGIVWSWEPWLLFYQLLPVPHSCSSSRYSQWGKKEMGLFGSVLHRWGNWALIHMPLLSTLGAITGQEGLLWHRGLLS